MLTFSVIALGCKVNQCDAASLADELARVGFVRVPLSRRPHICIVQACAVTAEAARKSRQAVRHAARRAERVVLAGCLDRDRTPPDERCLVLGGMTPADAATTLKNWVRDFSRAPHRETSVGGRIGTTQAAGLGQAKDDGWMSPTLPRIDHGQRPATSPALNIRSARVSVKRNLPRTAAAGRISAPPATDEPGGQGLHARAFVKIQDGCDARCSFCIVPQTRPALHSRSPVRVQAEVAGLVRAGYREVVLCGIFLGAYGRDTAIRRNWHPAAGRGVRDSAAPEPAAATAKPHANESAGSPLVELLNSVCLTPGLARLRLSSLEPADLTDELLELMAARANFAPHLHLPLQSGSDRILRRMNRQYDAGEFRRAAQRLRAALDRPAITTDVIVGFPGETDADFEQTLAALRDSGVCHVHAFPFSPRAGTPADRWRKDFVPAQTIRLRMARLLELAGRLDLDYRGQFLGQTQRVVIEYPCQTARLGSSCLTLRRGRTDRYFMVHFPQPPADSPSRGGDRQSHANGCADPGVGQGDELARRTARVRVERVERDRTLGSLISVDD